MNDSSALVAKIADAFRALAWRDSQHEPLNAHDDADDLARAAVEVFNEEWVAIPRLANTPEPKAKD